MRKFFLVLVIVGVIVSISGVAVASAANTTVPGDTLYGVHRDIQELRLAFAASPESAVALHMEYAQDRLYEIQTLVLRQDQVHLDEAVTGLNQEITAASSLASTTTGQDAQLVSDTFDQSFNDVTVTITPTATTEPGDGEGDGIGSTYCTNPADPNTPVHPVGDRLATRYSVPYATVMAYFCQGYGFGEIDLAYQIASQAQVSVEELFAMRAQGLGWGEIMQAEGLIGHPGKGNGHGGTVTPGVTPTVTVTSTATLTPTATITPTATLTATATMTGTTDCTGANPQPHGMDLANEFGVSYQEIMTWFCQGFGFGEIKLAYTISQETGVPVADLFAEKAAGKGWGEIMKENDQLGHSKDKKINPTTPAPGDNPVNNHKPQKPQKPKKNK